jgi:hypothetical protein
VALLPENLRRHVKRCPNIVILALGFALVSILNGKSEVSNFRGAFVDEDVRWLYISMNEVFLIKVKWDCTFSVHFKESIADLSQDSDSFWFLDSALAFDHCIQVP